MDRAYVSLLANGDGYLPGVEALAQSLDESRTGAPRILLVTPDVSAQARGQAEERGWQVREVRPIENPGAEQLLFARFAQVLTKLRAWELADVRRAVFLDADTIVLGNIDELFERRFAAAPDFFLPDRFNSGVMVLEPSAGTFAAMMRALAGYQSYDGGDQGFLNTFFADWYGMPAEHRLPVGYNMPNFIYQFLRGHPALKETLEKEARVIHYLVQKPWQAAATFTGGSAAWWRFYYQVHPELHTAFLDEVHKMQDSTFDRLAGLALGK